MKVVEVATVFSLDGSTLGLRLTCGNVSILFEGLTEEDERIEEAKGIAANFHSSDSDFRMTIKDGEFNCATILRRQNFIQAKDTNAAYERGGRDEVLSRLR